MGKYVIITLLEDVRDGPIFKAQEWPVHITLSGNFSFPESEHTLIAELQNFAATRHTLRTIATSIEQFGATADIKVTTLDMVSELKQLHEELIRLLMRHKAAFDFPHFIGDGYRAHVTIQPHRQVHVGDTVTIGAFTLVDLAPGGDAARRRMIQTFLLPD